MVKADPTLQMNVHPSNHALAANYRSRSTSTWSLVEESQLRRMPTLKSFPSESLLPIKLSPDPSSGTLYSPPESYSLHIRFQTRRQNKLKRAQGEIISVNEVRNNIE